MADYKVPSDVMGQEAPYPVILQKLIDQLSYKDGWHFYLQDLSRGQGSAGLTLCISVDVPDSNNPSRIIGVMHYMPVPPAAYNERSWRRWLFEQFLLVERHEVAEFFKIGGGRPYAPAHDPGNDPYLILEYGTDGG